MDSMMNCGIRKSEETVTEESKSEVSQRSKSSRVVFETETFKEDVRYRFTIEHAYFKKVPVQ